MSTKEKGSQFILRVPAGIKMPAGITGQEVLPQPASTQLSEAPVTENATPARAPAPQPEVRVTESYLSAKLRQSEQGGRTKQRQGMASTAWPGTAADNDKRMAEMWREMEDRISFKAPQAAQLPADFLRNMGLEGETILISPRAVEALKAMLGGKKNG